MHASSPHSRSTRWCFGTAAVIGILVVIGILARFRHLDSSFAHFDEVFPTALIERAWNTGNLDMNVRDADVPEISRYNQYAGSAYHYLALGWETVGRLFRKLAGGDTGHVSIVSLRAFSALCACAALLFFSRLVWRHLSGLGGIVAVALFALNPTLIQDAHYARPDALLLLGVVWVASVCADGGLTSLTRSIVAGAIMGVLIATKNTMALLFVIPLAVTFVQHGWPDRRSLVAYGASSLLVYAALQPGAWMHTDDFLDGVRRLQTQYSNPFPISGPLDGGSSIGMCSQYFVATLGAVTLLCAALGVVLSFRHAKRRDVLLWVVPLGVYLWLFGTKTIFFERAYSPFLPGAFVLCGVALNWLRAKTGRRALSAVIAALCLLPSAMLAIRFTEDVLGNSFDRRVAAFDQALARDNPGIQVVQSQMWHENHIEELRTRLSKTPQGFVAKVLDPGDEWTARMHSRLQETLRVREIATLAGPLEDQPPSTLQVYHMPTVHYLWVGDGALPSIPAVPSARFALIEVARVIGTYYGTCAVIGCILLLGAAAWVAWRADKRSEVLSLTVLVAVIFGILLTFRWPILFHKPELNVDEAHTISSAIKLTFDSRYWLSVDGTTHGPLNECVLLLPRAFGWPINYVTARIIGLLIIAGALGCIQRAISKRHGNMNGLIGILPAVAFFTFTSFWDFTHYTSEHLAILLLSVAWTLGWPDLRNAYDARRGVLGALLLGAVPYSKLQAIPIAAAIGAWVLWRFIRRGRLAAAATFVLCAALPSLVVLAYTTAIGARADFWQSYVVNNLRYATQTKMFSLLQMLDKSTAWLRELPDLRALMIGLGLFCAGGALMILTKRPKALRFLLGPIALFVIAVYSSIAPGRQFHHYLLFMVVPACGVAAAVFLNLSRTGSRSRVFGIASAAAFLCLTLGFQVVHRMRSDNPYAGDVHTYSETRRAVAEQVMRYSRRGEFLGIWGFMPRFYVETGRPHAAREAHNERQLLPHPQLAYYRNRYLGDLQARFVPVFLDAVGPGVFWPHDRSQFGHETWPELGSWVKAHYSLVADVDGVRVYVHNVRLGPGDTH